MKHYSTINSISVISVVLHYDITVSGRRHIHTYCKTFPRISITIKHGANVCVFHHAHELMCSFAWNCLSSSMLRHTRLTLMEVNIFLKNELIKLKSYKKNYKLNKTFFTLRILNNWIKIKFAYLFFHWNILKNALFINIGFFLKLVDDIFL